MNFFQLFHQPLKWVFYDCEILRCIPSGNEPLDLAFEWCGGWHDFDHMGISCIAAYSSWDNAYRIFTGEELQDFQKLVNRSSRVISFNGLSFDDKLCAANGMRVTTDFDLLSEVWVAAGLPPTYTNGVTIAGYNLNNLAATNLGMGKTGSGSQAPIWWQQGERHKVISYCLTDVYLSVEILKLGWAEKLIDPVNKDTLTLRQLQ